MILDKYIIKQIQKELEWFIPKDFNNIANTKLFGFLKGVECALFETGINFKIATRTNPLSGGWVFWVEVYQYDNYADCWSENKLIMTIFGKRVEYHIENKNSENE